MQKSKLSRIKSSRLSKKLNKMPFHHHRHGHCRDERKAVLGGIVGGIAAGVTAGIASGITQAIIEGGRTEHHHHHHHSPPPPPPQQYTPVAPPPPSFSHLGPAPAPRYPPCCHYRFTVGCLHCRDWQWSIYPNLPAHGCPPCQHVTFTIGCDSCSGWKWN